MGRVHFFILIAAISILLGGCKSTPKPSLGAGYWDDNAWQINTLQDLAFDYREDGKFDYEWDKEIPQHVRAELQAKAKKVVEKWTGE